MKKILLKIQFVLLAAITCHSISWAQVDPHFTQYYIHPMSINPALTGAIEGDYRVSAIWRSQYSNTLITKGVSGEVVTNKNTNFGFNLLNETSSDKSYNFTNGYLSMAYSGVRFGRDEDHFLVMALQCGFINRRFDVSKLQFGSQWVSGVGYDPNVNSGEQFTKPSIFNFDAGAGIAYYDASPNKNLSFFGGVSAFHITRPDYPFLSNSVQQRLPVRYSVHAGARITASDLVTVVPSAIYMREGTAQEKMLGVYVQMYVSETTDMMFGANWRFADAASPFVGVYYRGLTFGISYDVDVSARTIGVSKGNSLEVSISFVGQRKTSTKTNNFFCPRF
ncbi:MAG: PorP/SprF family type IX secretion system membrane protein [Bacteroidetes bacterium]|nr:PorP/SprF family type IX secretion system membrane protein [Bacteroidota bacterium]